MMHPEVAALKRAGFMVLQFTPVMWRVRGEYDFFHFYPIIQKYSYGHGALMDYVDIVEVAHKLLREPFEDLLGEPTRSSLEQAQKTMARWVKYFNARYPHPLSSTLEP